MINTSLAYLVLYSFLLERKSTKEKSARFTCTTCGQLCASDYNLKSHTRIHTGEKSYSCELCEYRSAVRGNIAI